MKGALHSGVALTLLSLGYLLCRNDIKSEVFPFNYLKYKGFSSKAPSLVISEGLDERIDSCEEPLMYLLSKDPILCSAIF